MDADIYHYGFENGNGPLSWMIKICIFELLLRSGKPICVTMQNFVKISQMVVEKWQFLSVRWRLSDILDLQNFKLLVADEFGGANMHHRPKFLPKSV